eukprot:COSAG01_NODE_5124_length_4470_cov_10.204987_6_plen_252_part_00
MIKQSFEGALSGCRKLKTVKGCHSHPFGYKSCFWVTAQQRCNVQPCWSWAVAMMATCPDFMSQYSSSFVGNCRPKGNTPAYPNTGGGRGPYSLAVYKSLNAHNGTGKCVATTSGECSKHCGKEFNTMIDDDVCGPWVKQYFARAAPMKSSFDSWITKCDATKPSTTNWIVIGSVITFIGMLMFGGAFMLYKFTVKEEGAIGGVNMQDIAVHKSHSVSQLPVDDNDGGEGDGGGSDTPTRHTNPNADDDEEI